MTRIPLILSATISWLCQIGCFYIQRVVAILIGLQQFTFGVRGEGGHLMMDSLICDLFTILLFSLFFPLFFCPLSSFTFLQQGITAAIFPRTKYKKEINSHKMHKDFLVGKVVNLPLCKS